jgi:hypothetical protein
MRIIPIHPRLLDEVDEESPDASPEESSNDTAARDVSRRTLGVRKYARRTLGTRGPGSRRTLMPRIRL